jgi:hypothetical protein
MLAYEASTTMLYRYNAPKVAAAVVSAIILVH